jgi:predicted nucleic acid-binding protein
MNAVFADSFYFFALLNERDSAHDKAAAFTQEFRGRIYTTDAVLLEVGDGLATPSRRAVFQPLVASLQANPRVSILPCLSDLMRDAVALYAQRTDKAWSLTDCLSFVVMQREGITEALTGDHHFEQAGFSIVLQ